MKKREREGERESERETERERERERNRSTRSGMTPRKTIPIWIPARQSSIPVHSQHPGSPFTEYQQVREENKV